MVFSPTSVILLYFLINIICKRFTFWYMLMTSSSSGTSTPLIQQLTQKLHSNFSLKQLGKFDYFLGIEINYCANKLL